MQLIDLSRIFHVSMPVFPGDTPPVWKQVAFVEKDGYNASRLHTGMHVGTHIDAPLHMVANGKPLSAFSAEHFIGPGYVVDARGLARVDKDLLEAVSLPEGAIVLVHTGWAAHFGTEAYYRDYPELTPGFAEHLVAAGVKIVGLDFPSPDRAPYQVHQILLSHSVLIIENLTNLDEIPRDTVFEVIALPPPFEADGAPLRVVARIL